MSAGPSSQLEQWITDGELRRAGEWLVRTYAADVFGLCAAIVRDPVAAEDLAQEAFSRAFGRLSGFRGEASARTWLLSITRNQCIDYLRAHRRAVYRALELDDDEGSGPVDDSPLPAELLENHRDVEAALASLTEGDRALVVLRFRQGLDYVELAQAFGIREGTVRMRLSRALARMREGLERMNGPAASLAQEVVARPRPAAAAPAPLRALFGLGRARRSAEVPPHAAPPPALSATPAGGPAGHALSHVLAEIVPALPPSLADRLLALSREL